MRDALGDCCDRVSVAAALLAQVHLHEAHAKAVHPPQQIQQPPWPSLEPQLEVQKETQYPSPMLYKVSLPGGDVGDTHLVGACL